MTDPQQPYSAPPGWQGGPHGAGGLPQGAPGGWPGAPVPHRGPTETEPKAVLALVLAVLAYTPTVPFLGAVAALFLARSAERSLDASGGARTGRGLVKAARVLAWVHLVLVALLFVLVLAVFLLPVSFSLAS